MEKAEELVAVKEVYPQLDMTMVWGGMVTEPGVADKETATVVVEGEPKGMVEKRWPHS